MKQIVGLAVAVLCISFVAVGVASAQVPYSEGNVDRVVLIHIKAGHSDAFWADMKQNVIPLFEKEKAAGLIISYQFFVNQTASGPDDWSVGYSIEYKNMAALDGLADKVYEVRMKQYGNQSAEQKVIDKRVENAHLVASYLTRDITVR